MTDPPAPWRNKPRSTSTGRKKYYNNPARSRLPSIAVSRSIDTVLAAGRELGCALVCWNCFKWKHMS